MPTSSDFGAVANSLRKLVGELEEVALPLERRMGAHVLEGGDLTDSVYESIKATRVTGLSLSAIVAEYAAEAERRKEEAIAAAKAREEYEDDLKEYRRNAELWESDDADGLGDAVRLAKMKKEGGPPERPTPPPDPPPYIDL